jgi:DNA-binding transcriptional MerR regulator
MLFIIANHYQLVFMKGIIMRANQVSKSTGVPISTLRFYERKKLIPAQLVTRDDNNYREYHDEILDYLDDLKTLLSVGFTIQELSLIVNECQTAYEERRGIVEEKIQHIQGIQVELEASKLFLMDVLEGRAKFQTQCGP